MVQLVWLYSFMNYQKPNFDRPLRMKLMEIYLKKHSAEKMEKIINWVNDL